MPQISYVARNFVSGRLVDAQSGFNYWIQQAAATYPGVNSFQLSADTNLWLGALTPQAIESSGDATYPLCIVYSQRAQQRSIVTPSEFAGTLSTVVDFYTGFSNDAPPPDPESLADAIEDAMYETFNRVDYYGLSQAADLTYNNEMDSSRGQLLFSGENWMQLVRFTLTHRFYTAGR